MVQRLLRTSTLMSIFYGIISFSSNLQALDTLRVGNNGNVSWAGTVFGAAVNTAPPEYKINRFATEIGNVPGNLIDLSNLDVVNPQILVKTLIEAPPALLATHHETLALRQDRNIVV